MVDIITIVMDNSQLILLVISIVLALAAKYFSNQAKAFADAAQAVTDLSQEVLYKGLIVFFVSWEDFHGIFSFILVGYGTVDFSHSALAESVIEPETGDFRGYENIPEAI